MAERFHFNPDTGRTGKCGADPSNPRSRGCKFGQSDGQHGATREEAKANYETKMAPELFSNTQAKVALTVPAQRARFADLRSNEYTDQLRYDSKLYERTDVNGKKSYIRALKNPLGTPIVASLSWDKEVTGSTEAFITVEVTSPQDTSLNGQRSIIEKDDFDRNYSEAQVEAQKTAVSNPSTAAAPIAAVKASAPVGGYSRFSESELDGEDWELQDETRYSAAELVELRQIDQAAIDLAEREDDGWVTVKVPSSSEVSISVELARRELKKVQDRNASRSSRGNLGGRYFF